MGGASPIYLLGKYYLGVRPIRDGYKEFEIAPVLGGLKWMEGNVPTPHGDIHLYMDNETIRVKAREGKGYLYLTSESTPKTNIGEAELMSENKYRLMIDTKQEVVVSYN